MKFTLEFDMDNAAFDDEESGVSRGAQEVLNGIAEKVGGGRRDGVIFDHNGNRIGRWAIEGERLGSADDEDDEDEDEDDEEEEGV
jgi:hypothetical protein